MQEMAFQDFKFQTFSGRECPRTPVVIHPLWKTSTLSNKSGQIWPWNIMYKSYLLPPPGGYVFIVSMITQKLSEIFETNAQEQIDSILVKCDWKLDAKLAKVCLALPAGQLNSRRIIYAWYIT
jgi:hypothetical protein